MCFKRQTGKFKFYLTKRRPYIVILVESKIGVSRLCSVPLSPKCLYPSGMVQNIPWADTDQTQVCNHRVLLGLP